jgi:hypothetical protein
LQLIEKVRSGWGAEFIEAMLGCFKNYMKKTKGAFLEYTDVFGETFVGLLYKVIHRVYQISLNGSDDLDMILVTTLYIALIENHIGLIDNLIPYIVDQALNNLKIEKTKQLKVINLEVVSTSL